MEQLERDLTPRDRELLTVLHRVHLATGNQLRRSVWSEDSPAIRRASRRELARLVKWRVLARLERRQGGLGRGSDAYTYALDVAGLRLAGQTIAARRPHLPREAMWSHALMGAEVYTILAEHLRTVDRQLTDWQGEPVSWRKFTGQQGQTLFIKPDGYVDVAGPDYHDVAFVEIDTGSQSPAVITAKLLAYRAYAASGSEQRDGGVFPLTVFICTSDARQDRLTSIIAKQPAEVWPMFAVGRVADAPRLLTGGGS